MRDYETFLKSLDLPAFFKAHPVIDKGDVLKCEGLEDLVMKQIAADEIVDLFKSSLDDHSFFRDLVPDVREELMQITLRRIMTKVFNMEERTKSEGRMKADKLHSLMFDKTKTVFDYMKILHDLEQGARKNQSGQEKKINRLKDEINQLKADNKRLTAALQAAQIALADAPQKP